MRGYHGQAQHRLARKIGMDPVGSVKDLRIGWRLGNECVHDRRCLFQVARPGIQLDELHTCLDLDLLLFYVGESLGEVLASVDVVAGALFCHAKKRLNFPQPGLKLQRTPKRRKRSSVVALKNQQDAQISKRIDILWVERHDCAKFRYCQVRSVLLKKLLCLASVQVNFLLILPSILSKTPE